MAKNPQKSREQLDIDRAIEADMEYSREELDLLQVVAALTEEFDEE
jgi:hypothetical protein